MNNLKTRIIIFAIFAVTALLRIYNIEQKNLWFDEVYSWKISQGSITEIVSETSGDIHPPLYYIVLKYWTGIFSDSIFSMRMLSVIFSLLGMYYIFILSKMFLEKDYQIIMVLLLYAVSPLNIFYSQEIRMLNMNLFLCLGSVYYFLSFLKNGSGKYSVMYVIFTTFAVYTHYFAFLILFSEFITAVILYLRKYPERNIIYKIISCIVLINLLYIPWYPVFFAQTTKGQPWRSSQTLLDTGKSLIDYFRDIFLSPYFSFESNAVIYFSYFFVLLFVTFLLYVLFRTLNPKHFSPGIQNSLIIFFFVPLFTAAFISLRQSIVFSRYLSILIPYLLILLVLFAYLYFSDKKATAFIIFLIMTSCYGTYIEYRNNFKNNDYRKIISYIEKNYNPADNIISEPHFMGWSLNYYIKHNNTEISSPVVLGWDLKMQLDSLNKRNDLNRIWFILDYSSLVKKNYDSLSSEMIKSGYEKKSEKTFYVIPDKVKVEYFVKNENQ